MRNLFKAHLFSTKFARGLGFETLIKFGFLLVTAIVTVGCASPSGQSADGGRISSCKISENMLVDTSFIRRGEYARAWRIAQHTGERSFSTEVTDGVLEIRRIDEEPWMLFRQTVTDPRLSGATIRFSAELKGDLPDEPRLHGFDHVGGLYLKVGRGKVRLAEHDPNHDQWDWQEFSYEEVIPPGVTSVRAGFVHQSGGALWAKNPSLVILDCS